MSLHNGIISIRRRDDGKTTIKEDGTFKRRPSHKCGLLNKGRNKEKNAYLLTPCGGWGHTFKVCMDLLLKFQQNVK